MLSVVGHPRTWVSLQARNLTKITGVRGRTFGYPQKNSVATYIRAVCKHETLPRSRGFAAVPSVKLIILLWQPRSVKVS